MSYASGAITRFSRRLFARVKSIVALSTRARLSRKVSSASARAARSSSRSSSKRKAALFDLITTLNRQLLQLAGDRRGDVDQLALAIAGEKCRVSAELCSFHDTRILPAAIASSTAMTMIGRFFIFLGKVGARGDPAVSRFRRR